MTVQIMKTLKEVNTLTEKCHDLGYNGAVTSDVHSSVETSVKQIQPNTKYVYCGNIIPI